MTTHGGPLMRARAEATEETRRRMLQAAFDLTWDMLLLEITLDGVADRAAVSVQTVLRHFSSREGLFDAVEASASQVVSEERAAPSGGVDAAVSALFNHYARGRRPLTLWSAADLVLVTTLRELDPAGPKTLPANVVYKGPV